MPDDDWINGYSIYCTGCGGPIRDRLFLLVEPKQTWHAQCLICQVCGNGLAEADICFLRNGMVYCKPDYLRLYSMSQHRLSTTDCATCHQPVGYHQWRVSVGPYLTFHYPECARCVFCSEPVRSGSLVTIQSTGVVCIGHHSSTADTYASSLQEVNKLDQNDSRPNPKTETNSQVAHGRLRTVINKRQLAALRTCYSINARPDSLTKQRLAQMTGLPPRVIRVWFQNKRCLDKKRWLRLPPNSTLFKEMNSNSNED